MTPAPEPRRSFAHFSLAGIFFQGGAAAVDSATVVPALVHGLTGSPLAVGAAVATVRFGWLFPQLFVAYFAQRSARRMPFYAFGAFGRVACLAAIALLLALAGAVPSAQLVLGFFALWTIYAFVSGIVAVPYNDIVARSIPSGRRSRMLALRFFGGGLLALAVAGVANAILGAFSFAAGYASLMALAAALLLVSAVCFVTAGEPATPASRSESGFVRFVRGGLDAFAKDRRFRLFLVAQWLAGMAAMALPFYILQTPAAATDIAMLLAAQTAGALLSNPLWGWWGDRRGKRELLETVAAAGAVAPIMALTWTLADSRWSSLALPYFVVVFVLLGAIGNGGTIAYLGYLMEISPDDLRPAYTGYLNTLAAPAALFALAGGALAADGSFAPVFGASAVAAILQWLAVSRLPATSGGPR